MVFYFARSIWCKIEVVNSYTAKRKLFKRLALPVNVNDPMLPLIGVGVLQILTAQLKTKLTGNVSIGYALGNEKRDLPGKLKLKDPIAQAGHQIGLFAKRAVSLIK